MSFNQKALSAFKKLGAVVLITATLALFFTACKQTSGGGEGGKSTPKHAITFGVEGSAPNGTGGTLKAKADGIAETNTSPIIVEKGKTVTFTATANKGYQVKGWTLEGLIVREAGTNTEYKHTVKTHASVKVFFEKIPPTKYTVTLTQTEHGTVTASPEIPADKLVEEGKTVTFTAKANDGYRVGTWVISPSEALQSGGNKGETTATVKITANTTVSVNFEEIPKGVILTLKPDKLTIKVSAKTADGSAIEVEGCTETTLASDTETELHATGTTVTLRGKITEFDCSNNELTALDVRELTALQELDCYNNQLTDLDTSGLTTLKELNCSKNQLKTLNVKGCTALEELLCGNNQLTSLDASGLTTLKMLGCNGNQLASLNVSGCIALETLGCFRNRLIALNVQGLTSLQTLGCQGNQLTTVDISGLTALKRLGCHNNKINAEEMTKLLNALPARKASDDAKATLYTEKTEPAEENCKDYNTPDELKTALEGARGKNWKLLKEKTDGTEVDILFTYAITFSVEGTGGKLTAKADGEATETEASPINVEEGKVVTFTATPSTGYAVYKWTITGGSFENGSGTVYNNTAKLTVTANAEVKVSFIQGTVYTAEGVRFMMKDIAAVTNGTVGHSDEPSNQPHQVNISAYRIGETEVTQELWQAVMGENPSHFKDSPKNPVENINWYECIVFCHALTKKVNGGSADECVYRALGNIYDKESAKAEVVPEVREDKKGFRLPKDVEWEWAAKGSTEDKWAGTNDESKLGEYAWYRANSGWKTHEVKTKKPNGYGLYDMSGNVWEWCWDWYRNTTPAGGQDPTGPAASGGVRVFRGGSWYFNADYAARAYRGGCNPDGPNGNLGLRLVSRP